MKVHASALAGPMRRAKITPTLCIAAFLGNVVQETDRLKTLEEYGAEPYFRSFLGEQWRFHGRGYLMNTWEDAYRRLSTVLGADLVKNPDLLKRPAYAARAATWFWTSHDLNSYAAVGDFRAVAGIVNAGSPEAPHINGYPERLAFYEKALEVLGERTPEMAQTKRPNLAGDVGWYAQKYFTHHDWRPDVKALVLKYEAWWPGIYINTYFSHPPIFGRIWEFVSYDVWDRAGRGIALDKTLGWKIVYAILDDPNPPPIAWLLYDGWMWRPSDGWTVYDPPEDGSDPGHHRHIHVSHALVY